jgi:WhiB family redox-sensing transcriptional regulator
MAGVAAVQRSGLPAPLADHWDWQAAAACRGMDSDVFFHPPNERARGRRRRVAAAQAVCHSCPVIRACLAHARAAPEPYGIWGGLSEEDRAERLGRASLRYPGRRAEPAPTGP